MKPVLPPRPTKPIDLLVYAPYFITTIANRWTASASRTYQRDFGIGVAEWRVLAALAIFGKATSLDVANLVSMDPGAVSRAMKVLSDLEHVSPLIGRFKGRSKPFYLTPSGADLYERVRRVALQRESVLLRGIDDQERAELLRILRKIHMGLEKL